MLARLFVLFGGLFVLALLMALVGPHFINWTSYRAEFEREASAVLGRKVTVNGDASARILPFPSVTFSDVTVGGAGDRDAIMTVEAFSMDAELAPLLSGEFLIFDMRMTRPKAVIDVAPDGTVDWTVRPSTPFEPDRIALENLTVTDGEIVVRHRVSGREHIISGINADLSARSLSGPWRGTGVMAFDGTRASITASTGIAEGDGIRLKLDVAPEVGATRLALEGDLNIRQGAVGYTGAFRVSQVSSADEGDGSANQDAGASAGYRLSGKFDLDQTRVAMTDLRFETGPREDPYAADGSAFIDFGAQPSFTLQANGEQVLLSEGDESEGGIGLPLGERIGALEAAIRALPRPQIPGTIAIDLPAVVAGDTTVRDLHLTASPATDGWKIDSFRASLPGRSTLEAKGLIRTSGDFGFDGSMLLAVAQPSGFAAWLGQEIDEPLRRLPSAGFNASVKLSSARQSFSDLELILGDTRLHGSIDSVLPPDGAAMRPSLSLNLEGGPVDIERLQLFPSLFLGDDGFESFSGRDIDLMLKAGPVTARDAKIESLDAAVTLRDGQLDIRKMAVTGAAGARITASGLLSGVGRGATGNVTVTLDGKNLNPLVELAASQFPRVALLRGINDRVVAFPDLLKDAHLVFDAALKADIKGEESVLLSATGTSGGADLSAAISTSGSFELLSEMQIDAKASVKSPDGAPLLALVGMRAEPLGLTGPATLSISTIGRLRDGLQTEMSVEGSHFSAQFDGTVSSAPLGLAFNGPMSIQMDDVEPWMSTLGATLPGFGLGTPIDFRADVDYADGLLVLTDIGGSVDEDAVQGAVNIAMYGDLPEITGNLSLDSFDLPRAAAIVLGNAAFDEPNSKAPVTPFRESPLPAFNAALDISTGALDASRLGLLYDANFMLNLDAERIAVSGLTASFHDGKLSGNFELKNSAGTGLLTAQVDMRDAQFASAFEGGGIQGQGSFSANLSASGKTVESMIASLGGAGSAVLSNVHIAGLNDEAFQDLLVEADKLGREINADEVASFAKAIVAEGAFAVPSANVAFTVAGGMLRAPPLTLVNPNGNLDLRLQADLSKGLATVQGELTYAAGAETLVGSEPSIGLSFSGPFESTALVFDTSHLVQFLTQRALEREQARVEAMQEDLLEKQRLRREGRYYSSLAKVKQQSEAEAQRRVEAVRSRVEDRAGMEAEKLRRAVVEAAEKEQSAARRKTPTVDGPSILPSNDADIFRNLGLGLTFSPSQ